VFEIIEVSFKIILQKEWDFRKDYSGDYSMLTPFSSKDISRNSETTQNTNQQKHNKSGKKKHREISSCNCHGNRHQSINSGVYLSRHPSMREIFFDKKGNIEAICTNFLTFIFHSMPSLRARLRQAWQSHFSFLFVVVSYLFPIT